MIKGEKHTIKWQNKTHRQLHPHSSPMRPMPIYSLVWWIPHLENISEPGAHEKELHEMLTLNELSNIKAPNKLPSAKIITEIPEAEEKMMEEQEEME